MDLHCTGAINMHVSYQLFCHFSKFSIMFNTFLNVFTNKNYSLCFQFFFFKANVVRRVGYINFPHLMQITLLRDYLELIHMNSPHSKKSPNSSDHRNVDKSNTMPNLNLRSKIFELSSILDCAKVTHKYLQILPNKLL